MKAAILPILIVLLAGWVPGAAQQSAGYRLEAHRFNAGGRPHQGATSQSSTHEITLEAIGDAATPARLSGASFLLDGGLVFAYRPPGEVEGVAFGDATTLTWTAEESAGAYNIYRGLHSALHELGYGSCEQQDVAGTSATVADPVPSGDGYFYLVAVENLLGEEGTKGHASTGSERAGATCP